MKGQQEAMLDAQLVLLDFPRRYVEDKELALLELRLLLLDDRVCQARATWLNRLKGQQCETGLKGKGAERMTADALIRLLNEQSERGASNEPLAGAKLEQIHRLTCDSASLLEAHRLLIAPSLKPTPNQEPVRPPSVRLVLVRHWAPFATAAFLLLAMGGVVWQLSTNSEPDSRQAVRPWWKDARGDSHPVTVDHGQIRPSGGNKSVSITRYLDDGQHELLLLQFTAPRDVVITVTYRGWDKPPSDIYGVTLFPGPDKPLLETYVLLQQSPQMKDEWSGGRHLALKDEMAQSLVSHVQESGNKILFSASAVPARELARSPTGEAALLEAVRGSKKEGSRDARVAAWRSWLKKNEENLPSELVSKIKAKLREGE